MYISKILSVLENFHGLTVGVRLKKNVIPKIAC